MLKRPSFNSSTVLLLLLGAFLVFLLERFHLNQTRPTQLSGSCKDCNIIIIDIDILRADALDCNKNRNKTPNICSFFDKAVYFQDNTSHSDNTRASFVSAMTSLYPISHRLWTPYDDVLNSQVVTLPDVLQKKGYETILATEHNTIQLSSSWFNDVVNPKILPEKLEELAKKDRPFFAYVYNEYLHFPHLIYNPEDIEVDMEKVSKGIPKSFDEWFEVQANYIIKNYQEVFKPEAIKNHPELFQGDLEKNKYEIFSLFDSYSNDRALHRLLHDEWAVRYNSVVQFVDPNNPEDLKYFKSRYMSGLKIVDATLVDIFQLINDSDLSKNTIVVLRSDHGEEFYEHGQFAHQNRLYQETIHTPLVIRLPFGVSGKIDKLSQDIDLMPTLLDLLGMEFPVQLQGESLIPLIENPNFSIRDYQIAQKGGGWIVSFRKNDLKIIMENFELTELYNLASDPGETKNLLNKNGYYSGISRALFEDYNQIIRKQVVYPNPKAPFPSWIDEEKRLRLREEGYF